MTDHVPIEKFQHVVLSNPVIALRFRLMLSLLYLCREVQFDRRDTGRGRNLCRWTEDLRRSVLGGFAALLRSRILRKEGDQKSRNNFEKVEECRELLH